MRSFLFCVLCFSLTGAASAQSYQVAPNPIRQGDTLHITGTGEALQARLSDRTIRLFQQKDGASWGLMPIPVLKEPGDYKLELLGKDGVTLQSVDITVRDAHFATQNVVLSKAVTELKATPEDVDVMKAFRAEVLDTRYWDEPFGPPLPGCLTSPFGVQRKNNGKLTGDYHAGFDQRGKEGDPIRAIASGVVKVARPLQLQGGTVAINHGQGLQSIYMHMSKVEATEGSTVQKGDVIGYVGHTGRANGPHLHWSVYANGVPVNPGQWVPGFKSCYAAGAPKAGSKKRLKRTQH